MPKKLTTRSFIAHARLIHKDTYDYTEVDYKNSNTTVCLFCTIHQVKFYQKPVNHLQGMCGCLLCAKEKKKRTMVEKYGVENPSQSEEIKEKKKQTCLKNHGVSCPFQSEELKEKSKQTCVKRYGVEYSLQSDVVREKSKQSIIEKYGVENVSQSEEIKEKKKQTCLKNHGVEYPYHSMELKEKAKQTCLKNHGVEYSMQSEDIRERSKQTMIEKYGVENHRQVHITPNNLEKLNDKEWLYDQHINLKKSFSQMAKELNVDNSTVGKYTHLYGIETQYYFSSIGECEVFSFVEGISRGIKIIQGTRKIIPPYELDIYIPEHNLAIEYCGLYWHSEQIGKNKNYHENKFNLCKMLNIQLLTIFEDEWEQRNKQVKAKIKSLLHKDDSQIVFARKTQVVNVSKQNKKKFYNNTHIQGNGPSSINIGLMYNDNLIACMSFIKSKDEYTLNRYATSCRVPGGFSKLLKYFVNEYKPKSIISFADLRWSTGNLYLKTGWKIDKMLSPDYSYSPDGEHRFHKFNYRRKYLSRLLRNFDPELSGKINCDNNGVLRIWDCGKIRFKYIP